MRHPSQYRHAFVILLIFGLVAIGLNEADAQKCLYGSRAISAEAAGFDALAFQIFGNPLAAGQDGSTAALNTPSMPNQGGAK